MCIYYLYCVKLKLSDLNWACFLFSLLDLLTFLGKILQVKVLVPYNTDNGLLVTCARIVLQHPGHFLDLSVLDSHCIKNVHLSL